MSQRESGGLCPRACRCGGDLARIWTSTGDVDVLRRLAASGFDWLAIDAQHGPVDRVTLHQRFGRALQAHGAPFVVRVPGVDPAWIGAGPRRRRRSGRGPVRDRGGGRRDLGPRGSVPTARRAKSRGPGARRCGQGPAPRIRRRRTPESVAVVVMVETTGCSAMRSTRWRSRQASTASSSGRSTSPSRSGRPSSRSSQTAVPATRSDGSSRRRDATASSSVRRARHSGQRSSPARSRHPLPRGVDRRGGPR